MLSCPAIEPEIVHILSYVKQHNYCFLSVGVECAYDGLLLELPGSVALRRVRRRLSTSTLQLRVDSQERSLIQLFILVFIILSPPGQYRRDSL
jgi:hypothetical protein